MSSGDQEQHQHQQQQQQQHSQAAALIACFERTMLACLRYVIT
jgi:hypothetical protein